MAHSISGVLKYVPVVDWHKIEDFKLVILIGHVGSFIEAYWRLNMVMRKD